jgi:predicted chitinase
MDGKTLMAAMTYPGYDAPLPLARYNALAGPCTTALREARCGTVERVAMFLAQIGAESGSLRWRRELADGTAYDRYLNPDGPWAELGNAQRGDGARFKGRSFIQITGRLHYALLSGWAHAKGYVPTATYFIDHPDALADDKYAFLGPVYYWTVARNMNAYADRRDIAGGSTAVQGGSPANNLSGRTARWNKCLSLGQALLTTHSTDTGGTTALPTMKAGAMYQVIQDASNDHWYAYCLGSWVRIKHRAVLAQAVASPLCINRHAVAAGKGKGYRIPHADVVARQLLAIGSTS